MKGGRVRIIEGERDGGIRRKKKERSWGEGEGGYAIRGGSKGGRKEGKMRQEKAEKEEEDGRNKEE